MPKVRCCEQRDKPCILIFSGQGLEHKLKKDRVRFGINEKLKSTSKFQQLQGSGI
ncbi:MAG: hypothetical protein GX051_00470 [Clostridiales bacterium]|nr:hypothetical protein [Clostridiales bacterium]